MNTPPAWVSEFFDWLGRASLSAAILIVAIRILQITLRRWLSPRVQSALWLLVLARLVLPWTPNSSFSVENWIRTPQSQFHAPENSTSSIFQTLDEPPPRPTRQLKGVVPSAQAQSAASLIEKTALHRPARALPLVWLVGALTMMACVA